MKLNSIREAIDDIKNGRMIILVDDPSRENEGDLIVSAQHITPDHINFMAKYGRGLICVPLDEKNADKLELPLMTKEAKDPYKTAWAVSVDAREDITTGISAYDRAKTIKLLADPDSKPDQFVKPGHVFPLRSKNGGVLVLSLIHI